MYKRLKTPFIIVLAAISIAVLAPTTLAQQAIRIGTSSVGSTFYTIAIGAGEIIQKHAGLNATVEPVGGSSANMLSSAPRRSISP